MQLHRGNVEGALRALKRAIDVAPNDPDSLLWGSQVANNSGKSDLAERWAARLAAIDRVTPFCRQLQPPPPGCAAITRRR